MKQDAIWIHYSRPRPHWYRLDEAQKREKAAGWQAIAAQSERDGATSLGHYHIRGQHDFQTVEIWRFATPEKAFEHWSRLTTAGYNEWHSFTNNIGLTLEMPVGLQSA